jgi:hypothetical protein
MKAMTDEEKEGRYTLERIKILKPEVIPETIHLRAQRWGLIRISKALGIHHQTVAAICAEFPLEIAEEQRRRVNLLRSTADKLVELVADNPESVPANVRCLAASQLLDKAACIAGEATVRMEHVHRVDLFSNCGSWEDFVSSTVERNFTAKRCNATTSRENA